VEEQAILIARVLFWLVFVCAVFAPIRWSLFCLVIAAHLDITSGSFLSSSSVGLENSFRIAGLPLLLLMRMRWVPLKNLDWTLPQKLWIAFTLYAGVATLWSDYKLSAVKMVIYLTVYFVLFAILCHAWISGLLDVGLVRLATWCVIALALFQTYVLGDVAGTEGRLTTFGSAQYFAAYLLGSLAVMVFSSERGFLHYVTCLGTVVAIILSGSRYIFFSVLLLFGVMSIKSVVGAKLTRRVSLVFRKIFITAAFAVLGVIALISYYPSGRIGELLGVLSNQGASVEDVGTFAWRLTIYGEIAQQLSQRSATELIFGSGTSSGARLLFELEPARYSETGEEGVDGNRVLHSEFLRSVYEWGLLGLACLCAFIIAIGIGFAKKLFETQSMVCLAFWGILPSIIVALAIENILAGAASGAGIGILLAISYAWRGPEIVIRGVHAPGDLRLNMSPPQVRDQA
jgi:hypothetical protein